MLYLARVQLESSDRRWFLFDAERKMQGWIGESRRKLFRRWEEYFGEEIETLTRYRGVMRMSELVLTIVTLQGVSPTGEVN